MAVGHVMILMNVTGEVIEMRLSFLENELPVAASHADLICLVKFPVEKRVALLPLFSQNSRSKRDAVDAAPDQSDPSHRAC